MRVLITGGAGFLGRALAKRARAAGHEVTATDLKRGDVLCDLADTAEVWAMVTKAAPEVVVHLAAILTDASQANPVRAAQINAAGTAAVFDSAMRAKAKRIVYASSIAAVGPCAEGSGDDVALNPGTVYGVTKAFGEQLARILSGLPDAPAFLALRFGWIYGAGRDRGWRPGQEVIERFARGDVEVPYPDFKEAMDWTYVDDAVEVLMRAIDHPLSGAFNVFNAVGDRRMLADAVAHLRRHFPEARAKSYPAPAPAADSGLRNDRLEAALGYAPETPLEEGIDRMLGLRR
ncbi:MAG: NAD(P)-dependent oxidoreductase [Alphaproteobacteria bacterium]|nr:NAD(P)-dependent oxidoreductase [Alphaproteobacteria bacterium]